MVINALENQTIIKGMRKLFFAKVIRTLVNATSYISYLHILCQGIHIGNMDLIDLKTYKLVIRFGSHIIKTER